MAVPSVVLPEPDSPTSPKASPARMSKLTPSTARSCAGSPGARLRFGKATTRSSTCIKEASDGRGSAMVNAPDAVPRRDERDRRLRLAALLVGPMATLGEDAALRQSADARHLT